MSNEQYFAKKPYAGGTAAMKFVVDDIVPALKKQFPDGVESGETPFEPPEVIVRPEQLEQVCRWLKTRGFNLLMDIGGVDYLPREPRFEVVYHLVALPELWRLRLRVQVPEDDPVVPTVSHLWPSAPHAEREVWDMFGIRIADHPNLTRILNPDDWKGHPLRKDYPVSGPRSAVPGLAAERNWYHTPKRPGDGPGTARTPERQSAEVEYDGAGGTGPERASDPEEGRD